MKISLIVWSALIAGISAGYPAKRNGQSVEPYTETVSLTVQGKPTTVTHAIEVAYFTDSSHLETIQLTDNLVKNLHSWLDVCPFKRSKRSPPLGPGTLHGPIRLSKCTEGVIKEALQDLKPGGKLFGLIVSLRNYVFDLPGHVLNDPALKQFQEAAAAIPELQSVSSETLISYETFTLTMTLQLSSSLPPCETKPLIQSFLAPSQ